MQALRTVADWQAAYAGGSAPAILLPVLRERMAAAGAPVYLHVVSQALLAEQLARLRQRAAGSAGAAACRAALPLFGVPFVVKDNIDVAGCPTTAACPAFAHTAERSATAVQKLLDAGAVLLAKTNLDQFATGLVGTRSPYGAPASVGSKAHVSGGSSSGSALAVAGGDVPFSLGTDTAGSGRVPAGFNGLVGLKPTPGRVSTAGVLPACRTLDCVSIFARSSADAAQVLALIEGPDDDDDYSAFAPGPPRLPERLRLGVPATLPPLDADYGVAFDAACCRAVDAGHTLVALDFGVLNEVAALLYSGPWVAERHSVVRDLMEHTPQALDPVVREVIAQALKFNATDAFEGRYRLQALARRAAAVWQQCDALLVPTAPNHPTFVEVEADPIGANARLGVFTNFVNLLGWCALAVPAGSTRGGLPFGVTFIGRGGDDAALLDIGRRWCGEPEAASVPAPATAPVLPLAVVGAHLSGLPLNGQLSSLGATLLRRTRSAPAYRLYALPGTAPPRPGLLRCAAGGHAIELEVWALPLQQVGAFLAQVPSPLSLGTLRLEDGSSVHGFLCEPWAVDGATDISRFGGWRAYLDTL